MERQTLGRRHLTEVEAGMALAGVGAGVNELTALAATSEMAPTAKRGKYVAILIFTILPFCPSVLWGQLIASHAGWRYCGLLCGIWAAVGFLMTLAFYFPPPRVNASGLSRADIIKRIDFVGGLFSIVGMILFMCALQWGGYMVCLAQFGLFSTSDNNAVRLEFSSRPRSTYHRARFPRGLRALGDVWNEIPHVPQSTEAGTANTRPDPRHHLHIRSQLLLRDHVLADSSFQRLRS